MCRNSFTHLSKFISLGAKKGGLAALVLAAALDGSPLWAQQQTPAAPSSSANLNSQLMPVGFLNTDPDERLQDLEQTVAQQQVQLQAQQDQVDELLKQVRSGNSGDNGGAADLLADPAKKDDKDHKTDKPKGYIVGSDRALTGAWTPGGPVFASKNGDFKFHPRGLVQLDVIAPGPPGALGGISNLNTQDSATFRRFRLGADGTMYDTIDWVAEMDLAFALQNVDPAVGATPLTGLRATPAGQSQAGNTINAIQPTTVFMTFKEVPFFQNIRVGNQQDWISFEHIESARFLDFMERSAIMDAFFGANNNGYTPGVSFFRTTENQRANLQMGAYHNNVYDSGTTYDIGSGAWTGNLRGTWTPYYDEASNGRYMVHTALGTEYRTFNSQLAATQDGDNVRVRNRGNLRQTSSTLDINYVDTGNFYARSNTVLCPEFVWQHGPLLLQAEYAYSNFGGAATQKGGTSLGTVNFNGGYVEALYFLTGENRQYNRQSGVFDRVVPFQNAFTTRDGQFGWGAWQPGVRLDWLNLNSGAVQGGQMVDANFGLNWFLNSNARFQFNFVLTKVDNSPVLAAAGTLPAGVALAGSRPVGSGYIQSFGARMDFNW
jgi:phosphate-selective porin OprO/OprP